MRAPSESWRPFRLEAALNAPADAPAWQDLSLRIKGDDGVRIDRGSRERRANVAPGRAQLTLDDSDGALPTSLYRRRFRLAYRAPQPGNLLDADSASFESGTGSWTPAGSPSPTIASSNVRAWTGSRSMLITWGAAGFLPLVGISVPTVIGRRYRVMARVWVPSGSPAIVPVIGGVGLGTGSSTTGAWEVIAMTWTATSSTSSVQLWPGAAPTAGQQAWVDGVVVDEADLPAEVIQRTNLMLDPGMRAATIPDNYGTGGGRLDLTKVDDPTAMIGTRLLRATSNVAQSAASGYVTRLVAGVLTGETYSFSVYFRTPTAGSARCSFQFRDPSGATVVSTVTGTTVTTNAGEWTRVSVTATVPSGSDRFVILITDAASMALGDYFELDAALLEKSDLVGDYFDGTSAPWMNVFTDPRRTDPANPDGWTANEIGVGGWITGDGSLYSKNYPANQGETWTFSADVTAPATQPVTLYMVVRPTQAGSFFGSAPSAGFTIPAGQTMRVSRSWTLPVGVDGLRAQINGITVNDGTARIDRMLLERAPRPSAYFEGVAPRQPSYRWSTTPNASSSDQYLPGLGTFTTTTLDSLTSYRFTGRCSTKEQTFPALGRSEVPLVLLDELGWGSAMFDTFIDVPGQEILSRGASALYRLVGADPSDETPAGQPLTLAGTGADPVASSSPVSAASDATGATFAGGRYLTGQMAGPVGSYLSNGVVITALVRTTAGGHVHSIGDAFGDALTLSVNGSGQVVAATTNQFRPELNMTVTTSVVVNDGRPHVLVARWASDNTLAVFVDGAAAGGTTLAGGWTNHRRANITVSVGGNRYGATFTGTIANAAVFDAPLANGVIADLAAAPLTGFQGEPAASRLARYNRWAGSPFAVIDAAGATAQVGHFDTDGKGLTDCIDAVTVVEDGLAFVRGDGALVLRSRSSLIRPTVAVTLPGPGDGPSNVLRDGFTLREDPEGVVNDLEGSRPGGQQRVISSSSIDAYGRRSESIDGPFASDAALAAVLEWMLNTQSSPITKVDGLSVRLSQLDDTKTAAVLAADIGSVIGWNALPSQAPASSDTGVIVGLSEVYSSRDLLWTPDVAPNPGGDVWVIEDPVYGQLDSTHRISY